MPSRVGGLSGTGYLRGCRGGVASATVEGLRVRHLYTGRMSVREGGRGRDAITAVS